MDVPSWDENKLATRNNATDSHYGNRINKKVINPLSANHSKW